MGGCCQRVCLGFELLRIDGFTQRWPTATCRMQGERLHTLSRTDWDSATIKENQPGTLQRAAHYMFAASQGKYVRGAAERVYQVRCCTAVLLYCCINYVIVLHDVLLMYCCCGLLMPGLACGPAPRRCPETRTQLGSLIAPLNVQVYHWTHERCRRAPPAPPACSPVCLPASFPACPSAIPSYHHCNWFCLPPPCRQRMCEGGLDMPGPVVATLYASLQKGLDSFEHCRWVGPAAGVRTRVPEVSAK